MRALLKNYKNEQLVYVNVKYENNRFYTADGEYIRETDIIDISRDNRNNYAKCSCCGELIKNTPEAFEAHKEERASQKNCLKCSNVSEGYGKSGRKVSYTADPNNPGKYIVKVKYSTELYCNQSYHRPCINTEEANNVCKYYACRNAHLIEINDTFTKYPNLFDVLPTVDMLLQKRWKFESYDDNYIMYHHPTTTTLKAVANSKGIVVNFYIAGYEAMYSKKYNKLFYCGSDKYKTNFPSTLNDNKKTSATNKIADLF
jgi:hypothetical protein